LNWTALLAAANIPESPGRDEAIARAAAKPKCPKQAKKSKGKKKR
jgi:hypothetical protein